MTKRVSLLLAVGLFSSTQLLIASPWQCLKDWTDNNSEWLQSNKIDFNHSPSSDFAEGYKFKGDGLSYKAGFWVGTAIPQNHQSEKVLHAAQNCYCSTFVGPYDRFDGTAYQFVGVCGYW